MRIAETTYRECCQLQDLVDGKGKTLSQFGLSQRYPDRMTCRHCKAEHEYYCYTDAAGSTDWDYRKAKKNTKSKIGFVIEY